MKFCNYNRYAIIIKTTVTANLNKKSWIRSFRVLLRKKCNPFFLMPFKWMKTDF